MNFSVPKELSKEIDRFKGFTLQNLLPNLEEWYRKEIVPRSFYSAMGKESWFGFKSRKGSLLKLPALREALITENLALISPGVTVAILAHVDLGLMGLWLYGSEKLIMEYGKGAVNGEMVLCLGNTEGHAGSDVAQISTVAKKVKGGWILNGTKAYVTNGLIGDMALITAVSDPKARRNRRLSMYLADLSAKGVKRTKLNKQGWLPSDLTRITLHDVFVPDDHLIGERGRGLQQVLNIFTHSRVPISALTLGTAMGAFDMAIDHAKKRKIFGERIIDFQAKAFEVADYYARMEAARLMLWKACQAMDLNKNFRLESSMAKYLAVEVAREVASWAADLFGAASIIFEHPVHKFPMDIWASSLGEGTQDVQKLVIFREVMRQYGITASGI